MAPSALSTLQRPSGPRVAAVRTASPPASGAMPVSDAVPQVSRVALLAVGAHRWKEGRAPSQTTPSGAEPSRALAGKRASRAGASWMPVKAVAPVPSAPCWTTPTCPVRASSTCARVRAGAPSAPVRLAAM